MGQMAVEPIAVFGELGQSGPRKQSPAIGEGNNIDCGNTAGLQGINKTILGNLQRLVDGGEPKDGQGNQQPSIG